MIVINQYSCEYSHIDVFTHYRIESHISKNIFLYLFLKQFTRSGSRVLFLKSDPSGSAAPRLQIEYLQISLKPRYIAGSELHFAYL